MGLVKVALLSCNIIDPVRTGYATCTAVSQKELLLNDSYTRYWASLLLPASATIPPQSQCYAQQSKSSTLAITRASIAGLVYSPRHCL